MRSNAPALGIVTLLSALGGAALLVGCADRPAPAEEPAVQSGWDAAGDRRVAGVTEENAAREIWEAELARREAELARLEERLAATVRAVETRDDEVAVTSPAAVDQLGGPPAISDALEPIVEIAGSGVEPAPAPRTVWITVPESEPLEIEFLDELSSEASLPGDRLRARLTAAVLQDGLVALPAGSEFHGSVAEAVATRRIGGQARLVLQFDRVLLPSGDSRPLSAGLELLGKRQTAKDAGTIGGSAAGGALLGRILAGDDDRDKGTVIGAVIGAAVGTAVASRNANLPVTVEIGRTAELFLDAPLELAVLGPPEEPILAERGE